MYNFNRFFVAVLVSVSCLTLFVGCGTLGSQRDTLEPIGKERGRYLLKLNPQMGVKSIIAYYSHSHVEVFQDQQILRERDDITEFSTQEEVVSLNLDGKSFIQRVTIVEKDGGGDLHSLGFPKENEELELHLTMSAEVQKAIGYPKNSIFYVPPISLPKGRVRIGETWALDKQWVSQGNGIPLKLEIISVLKGVYTCGRDRIGCADIEISGSVKMVGLNSAQVQFSSEIRGRLLFAMGKGTLLWSVIKSQEKMITADKLLTVRGCMSSHQKKPTVLRGKLLSPKCKPIYDLPKVPGT